MDLATFVRQFVDRGRMNAIASDSRLQFGTAQEPLLFARYLPVLLQPTNLFSADLLAFRQISADDGSPLSPPQIKNPGTIAQGLVVEPGHIDLAMQLDAATLTSLRSLLATNDVNRAELLFSEWLALNIRIGIEVKAERQRVEAIVNAQVSITNKNGQRATVLLPNPVGSRLTIPSGTIAAPTGWYSPTYDPMTDILAMATYLNNNVQAVILSSRVLGVLLRSPLVRQSTSGTIIVRPDNTLATQPGLVTRTALDGYFLSMGLPAPIVNDAVYYTQLGQNRFVEDSKVIFLGNTPQRTRIGATTASLGQLMTSTLGYYGVGTSLNQGSPGLVITPKVQDLKPQGIYVEGYQDSFPVIQQNEAIAVLTIPVPT